MKRDSSAKIGDAAALWAARIDRAPLEAHEQAALDAWLAGDSRCAGALMRARAALMRMDAAQALGPDFTPATPRPHLSRRTVIAGSGGLLAASLSGFLLWPRSQLYRTGTGEVRLIPLDDGSIATLNTQSEMEILFSREQRLVRLIRGEGYFEVAKDKARPFIVAAMGAEVRAVGTAFTVRALPSRAVDVRVQEGVVEVAKPAHASQAVRMAANMEARIDDDNDNISPVAVTPDNVQRVLLWREGRLSFESETLANAVAEFNRYNRTAIILADQDIGKRHVTGLFSATDPQGFAQAIALSMDLNTRSNGNQILIESR
ncbi:FecR family protein [Sphingobium sp. AP50]|uniref:FecR family protein n=1 Tax=Sphingobium sp. AP50 TaxID=1884369 RepID=UPI0008D1E162|nr:FecR domain-containing protein [Sphingobium sp. AP50]SEJ16427.1 FecR family protein [Sphingobium sp. AP50]